MPAALAWKVLNIKDIDGKKSNFMNYTWKISGSKSRSFNIISNTYSALQNDPMPAALAWQVANEIMIDRDKKRALSILEWQTN